MLIQSSLTACLLPRYSERLYEVAGKCESDLNVYGHYANTMACDFIKSLSHWGVPNIKDTFKSAQKNLTPKILAGVFAATTLVFAAIACHLHKKNRRQNVELIHGGQYGYGDL